MKMEARIDRIDDKLDKVSEDVIELKNDMKHLMPRIDKHITGDQKIISELIPVLERLPIIVEIAEKHQFERLKRKERNDKIKYWTTRLGLLSIIIGSIAGVTKILGVSVF